MTEREKILQQIEIVKQECVWLFPIEWSLAKQDILKEVSERINMMPIESQWITDRNPKEDDNKYDDQYLTIEDWIPVIRPFYDWYWEDWTDNKPWMPLPLSPK